jgi:ferredoxin
MQRFKNWNRGRGEGLKLHNSKQICVCPGCGYSKPHVPGIPCRTETCPHCKVTLVRSTNGLIDNNINIENRDTSIIAKQKSKHRDTPKVNPEICTGCGICIDNCPEQAIELVMNKAFIIEDMCTNYRLCENQCSVGAIS